ncbi:MULTISPECIES: ROK family transcriptional regulator [unclassified Streptomyces]|uniref:ROK family transcriptional regulator n=1 Tax=unclassified Streptomyces TaxID=2593676 RepID=UPI002E1F9D73|nr:ROK family transcriptional regulator [Streptomyces sp. NBC_01023]
MNRSETTGSGANLPALRSHNAALVLELLRTAGEAGISRLELAERTGLTPQAVSKITARLRADGLAAEAGHRASTGGKPRTVLRLVPGAAYAVGLHLDRDRVSAVLVDLAGTVVADRSAELDFGAGADAVAGAAAGVVSRVVADGVSGAAADGAASAGGTDPAGGHRAPVLGVGVAAPGPLDHDTGVLRRVTGFPQWDGYPLRDALAERLGLPVVLDKDTNAAALGLALRGPGDSFAYLHLGTGLGAGLVLGGALYRGPRTGAGEFGHQTVQLDGPPCDCGGRGCVEALCLAAVAGGDHAAAARFLGVGAANLVRLLDVDRVLLGGRTVDAAPDVFVRGVGAVLAERARHAGGGEAVRVEAAGGGRRLVAEGAAQLALAPVFGHFGRAAVPFNARRT